MALVGLSLYAAADAAAHPQSSWDTVGLKRDSWLRWLLIGAPLGVGFGAAIAYFAKARPQLAAATIQPGGMVTTAP